MQLSYPVELHKDTNDTVVATFLDFPEAATFGENEDEALHRAIDALIVVIGSRMGCKEEIPTPSKANGRHTVTLPLKISAKVMLYIAMQQEGIRKAELARRMHVKSVTVVDRLLDIHKSSNFDQIEAALDALGRHFVLEMI